MPLLFMSPRPPLGTKAFSLMEMVVALTLVGVIATITAPSLISSVQGQRIRGNLQETTRALSRLVKKGVDNGALVEGMTGANLYAYFSTQLKTLETCSAAGCTDGWLGVDPAQATFLGGLVLQNGTVLNMNAAMTPGTLGATAGEAVAGSAKSDAGYLWVDANGSKPPNVHGQDRMMLCFYFGLDATKSITFATRGWGTFAQGEVRGCDYQATTVGTTLPENSYATLWTNNA